METQELEILTEKSKNLRKDIFITAYHAGGGHIAGSLSAIDILNVLYFGEVLKYNSKDPNWKERDKFILSKGHSSLALYTTLAEAGYFPKDELLKVGKPGSKFGGHPKMHDIPGVEASTGALGHGLSFAIGNAYASKQNGWDSHVYVMLGDGECQEGSIWEGALSAPTLKLDNLTVIIDHNKCQAMDKIETIVNIAPFAEKWRAFGWETIEIDGHNLSEIKEALLRRKKDVPVAIIANTIKGKGVSFMEDVPIWHYRMPNEEELPILMTELGISEKELGIE